MTDYYDDPDNVEEYVKMSKGYDGRALIDVLRGYLPEGVSLLELGMGPGVDLEILRKFSKVTGSDRSQVFLDRYRRINKDADLLHLDALTVNTNRHFDAIYSNKVLHHLAQEELRQSFVAQARVLHPNGILFHSFWYGEEEGEMNGLRFTYYTEGALQALVGNAYELLAVKRYQEIEEGDSLNIVLKRKNDS